jgi:hypothetical protein
MKMKKTYKRVRALHAVVLDLGMCRSALRYAGWQEGWLLVLAYDQMVMSATRSPASTI